MSGNRDCRLQHARSSVNSSTHSNTVLSSMLTREPQWNVLPTFFPLQSVTCCHITNLLLCSAFKNDKMILNVSYLMLVWPPQSTFSHTASTLYV